MVYQPKNPVGYKQLLTWQQAGEIMREVKVFVRRRLSKYEDKRLTGHLVDSARSVQRNIEEGYKRATTKEYVEFLGFSRGSLEELKGDFEELKREINEGIRGNKGDIRDYKGGIRDDKDGIGDDRGGIGDYKGGMKEEAETLLSLIYGEDCMLGRQIKSLEEKMVREKTLPSSEMVKRAWREAKSSDDKFWKTAREKFGIKRDEKGFIIRENRGK